MTARTNTSPARSTIRTSLGIALAAAMLSLTPLSALADGSKPLAKDSPAAQQRSDAEPAADIWAGETDPDTSNIASPDYNGDGIVDINDLFDFLAGWLEGGCGGDTNRNGRLEVEDVFLFIQIWFNAFGTKTNAASRQ